MSEKSEFVTKISEAFANDTSLAAWQKQILMDLEKSILAGYKEIYIYMPRYFGLRRIETRRQLLEERKHRNDGQKHPPRIRRF